MKSLKDWISSQLVSMSLVSSRPVSGSDGFFTEDPSIEELDNQGAAHSSTLVTHPTLRDTSPSFSSDQENRSNSDNCDHFQNGSGKKKRDPLVKINDLQVKFLRLLLRLGLPQNNLLVAKVLYRIHLATLIRAEESDLKRANLVSDRAKAIAAEQEAAGLPELDFSLRILVLGKTGVGKSATINSIFDQMKTVTNAFRPGTDHIQEVVGTINGIRVTMIDTPGFVPLSTGSFHRNKQILLSLKRFVRKCPPDVVLFFERLDLIHASYNDFPLLKLITEVFGPAIWFNAILVMTHSSSALPEGPDGYPVSYDTYVRQSTDIVQHYIHQAVSDSRLENPVLLVENHPHCKKDATGEKILPNGQVWKSQFLLLCLCTKVLGDVNILLKFQDSIQLGPSNATHAPSLPHLLSSLLRHHTVISPNGVDVAVDESLLSEMEEDDEYDQLPPIQILTKSQFEKLTKSQKKDYLDELNYRETLYLKKQLKEEYCRQMEIKCSKEKILASDDSSDSQQASREEAVLLPDMEVPPSFGSNCPAHRYRCLVTSDQWIMRPVLDPHGWDNDVCFDGISLETAVQINRHIDTSVAGQMSKDKQDFSIQSECAAAYSDPSGSTYFVGLDVQSAGKDTMYTFHSNTKLRKLWHNIVDCGVSLTSFGNKHYIGAKLEDTISVGKRLKFVMNAGQMVGPEQVAYGGGVEATLRGRDYPVRNDNVSLTMTILSFNNEMVMGGSIQSESRLDRNLRISVNANLNSRKMGKICIKTSSTDNLQFSMVAAFTIFWALLRRKDVKSASHE